MAKVSTVWPVNVNGDILFSHGNVSGQVSSTTSYVRLVNK